MCSAQMSLGEPDKASMPCSREICKLVIVYTLRVQLSSPWRPGSEGMEKRRAESWSGHGTHQESEEKCD